MNNAERGAHFRVIDKAVEALSRRCGVHPEKRRFGDKRAALRWARAASREHGKTFSAYRCPDCRDWHLTTQTSRRKDTKTP